ncbi:MAG TPA: D-alanyl-D-alanine carboxypeptidase family protein, partial [Lautropia sp.]|nr:D-alanyl-D-alanine carboxypeptidase family protein [Lautropia sp.]
VQARPSVFTRARRSLRAALTGALLPLGLSAVAGSASGLAAWPALAQVAAPEIAARAWLLIDTTTRTVLYSQLPDERVEPASLTKLMTAYVAFDAIKQKRLALDQRPPVSTLAHKAIGSRMFLEPKSPATVEELLNGLIVQSGNDAATVLAEAIGGSESQFADIMNSEAKRLGMTKTRFVNASGLPHPDHYSTPRDLALLAMRLIDDHPDYYKLYSQKEYTYNKIRQPNRNRLLFTDPTVDGFKTGHTDAAGYCLISSARREQPGSGFSRRILSVLIGASSENSRAIESQKLLNYGFQNFDAVQLYRKGAAVGSYQVWKGQAQEVKAGFTDDVMVTVPKAQVSAVKGEIERTEPLVAPITAGQQIGTLRVRLGTSILAERPVVALEAVEPAGFFARAWDTMRLWIK